MGLYRHIGGIVIAKTLHGIVMMVRDIFLISCGQKEQLMKGSTCKFCGYFSRAQNRGSSCGTKDFFIRAVLTQDGTW